MFEISSQSGLITKFKSYSMAFKTKLQTKVFGVRNGYLTFEEQNNIWKESRNNHEVGCSK